jgi:hypothetical protein
MDEISDSKGFAKAAQSIGLEASIAELTKEIKQLRADFRRMWDLQQMISYPAFVYSHPRALPNTTIYPQSTCGGNLQNDDGTSRQVKDT